MIYSSKMVSRPLYFRKHLQTRK